ncbi:MAG: hypothetical protein J1E96_06900 [Ruminococcus sp.]|nr:hypothetical protein [Ruminococcus sp.]
MATTKKAETAEVKTEAKATEKKTAAKKPATKTATKAAEKKTAEKKPAEKKTAAKKAPAKKAPAKKATTTKKAAASSVDVFVEFGGVQVSIDEVIKNVKLTNGKAAKNITVYLKPEESKAYFVADGEEKEMDVFFC